MSKTALLFSPQGNKKSKVPKTPLHSRGYAVMKVVWSRQQCIGIDSLPGLRGIASLLIKLELLVFLLIKI